MIRDLPPWLIAQIAAGEVVTRAGDAVKELVENAIDAVLARAALEHRRQMPLGSVTIEITDGGNTQIRVSDDGCGITPDELPAALRRHATSKIRDEADLHALGSLGFRGEALAAISAVADITLVTATPDADLASRLVICEGIMGTVEPVARRPGTTVTVERLFARLPARQKYQRAASAETAHIGRLVQQYALAYPEISFSLTADRRRVLSTPGLGELRDAAAAIFGPEAGRELVPLRDPRDVGDEAVRLVSVTGLIGPPALHRATRNGIFITVNRRPVESRSLVYALEEAYATQIMVGRHPVAILDITVPAEEVDANVHPTKREVRLLRDRLVFGAIQQSVRLTLADAIGVPRFGETRGQIAAPTADAWSDAPTRAMFPTEPSHHAELEKIRPRLGGLRILGQVALTYIICEGQAGLYLVDQHAAHERVLLERLEHALENHDQAQLLLEPVAVELPRVLRGQLDAYIQALEALGFSAEPFGDSEIVVRSVPSSMRPRDIERVLNEAHETLDAEGAGPDWRERLALLLSCKTAVKAGQRLEVLEMQSLLEQLDEATLCATCSHGRPTAILLSHTQLEREFGRR